MKTLPLLFISLALLAGCATSKSGDVYSRDQARREMNVRMGTVESVRTVALEGTKSGVGTVAGAAVGGVAGSGLGGGKGQIVGAVLGAVVGGLAGSAVEEGVTRKDALEITVKLDNDRMIVVVQEAAPGAFRPGERVRVVSGTGETRITH
ncbi:glycine zipper 2TM domain-containing protein [Dechloromonas denitrificans]|uniref:glycine zipper 2TM domain-containing protein n=1 Tax=Dechloromonas denitrificans TaxID=281362 RepID=UPI001CF906F7|nr:glycine zipper 2TM domain-containing protein [Dechloromonas denitrificans]UCV11454.1 glycine zipper 2TM domain-containing protein [Dechloromonas denitrificans]